MSLKTIGKMLLARTIGVLAPYLLRLARVLDIWSFEAVPFGTASLRARRTRTTLSKDTLRRLNRRAVEALNEVDIAGCIRDAMPGATMPCTDEEIEKLEIKELACLYLGIALLQGLGRLDEAVFWWREHKRIIAAIVRHHLGQPVLAGEIQDSIFDQFWLSHVGHTALLGIHVKKNLLEGKPYRRLALLRTLDSTRGNDYLINHWEQYFTLLENPDDLPSLFPYSRYFSKQLYLEERLAGPDTYFWRAYTEISRAWEQAGGGPLLELSNGEIHRGKQALAAMGVPGGAWYVCLHVRSSGFKPLHEALQDTLNADIATYDLAIDAIVARGGWVIRMGDPSMPALPARNGVVDYAHSPQKADWMDIFLCGTCWFYAGTSSGLAYVPNLFEIPCVFTNWFPTGTRPLNGTDIFIPKLHWYDKDNDFVPFAESLAPPLGHIHARPTLRDLGVSLKDNTPEDLRDVVIEMMDRLEAKAVYTASDRNLLARFETVATQSRSFGNARIGREFIRKYRRLLPSGEVCAEGATRADQTAPQIP
jgi:putative glycosyltransferase (TIGR04372 family)